MKPDQKERDAARTVPELRHRSAGAGTDIRMIKASSGHTNWTRRHARPRRYRMIAGIESALDLLSLPRKRPRGNRRETDG